MAYFFGKIIVGTAFLFVWFVAASLLLATALRVGNILLDSLV